MTNEAKICEGLIAFVAGSAQYNIAFNWLLALSGLSSIFTWMSICGAHIRFRKAWRVQGHSLDELAFRSRKSSGADLESRMSPL